MISLRYITGNDAPLSSAVLAKGLIDATPFLESEMDWANRICSAR